MDYSLECQNDFVVIAPRGRVDESSWAAFGAGLSKAIEKAGEANIAKVVIDLGGVDYMSSRGLRVLTVGKREGEEAGVAISLASPNAVMREILSISRYDKLFTISETVTAAQ